MAEETIRVTMEADSAQLQAEFRRTRETMESLSKKTLPLLEKELNQVFLEQEKMRRSMKNSAAGMKNFSGGLLQIAYFADDAQYGLRGILNNIPGLVMGFGGGAGIAGALSLAALGFDKLLPKLREFFGTTENAKELEELARKLGDLREEAEKVSRVRGEISADRFLDALQNEERVIRDQNDVLALNVSLLEARRRAAGDVDAASNALALTRIQNDPRMDAEEKVRRTYDLQVRLEREKAMARIQALEEQVRAAEGSAADGMAAVQRIQQQADDLRRQMDEDERARAEMQRRLAQADEAARRIPGVQARIEAMEKGDTSGIAFSGGPQQRAQQFLDELERSKQLLAELENQSRAAGQAERNRLAELDGALEKQRKALEDLARREADLARAANLAGEARNIEIQKAQEGIAAERERMNLRLDALKVERDGALKNAAAAAKKESDQQQKRDSDKADDDRKKALAIARARASFLAEMQELELRKAGRTGEADALAKERQLRREAVGLAEALNVEEEKALELLRQKARLESEMNGGSTVGQKRSRIGGDLPGSGLRRVHVEHARGLGVSVSDRAAAARRMPSDRWEVQAAQYFQRSLTNEDTIISIFKKLGVV